jgi:hypothetical protein
MPRHLPRLLALVVAATIAGGTSTYAAADGFVMICNARAATRSLSRADVRALYTGKAKTLGGNAVVVVIRGDDDPSFAQFVDQVFGVATKTLLSKIKQEVFKGEMTKPVKAATDDEVIQNVGASPGMLGVVSAQGAGHLPSTVVAVAVGS